MSFKPQYTITDKLLSTILEIGQAIGEIKSFHLTDKALAKLKCDARELSTFASTSIEGNPLPLSDVKYLLKNNKEHIRDTEREVLNYNSALQNLYASISEETFSLDITALETIQGEVTDGLMANPADCGNIRQAGVIICNPRKRGEIVFLPPDAKDVKKLTSEMMTFINQNFGKIDSIILAGLFHKQCVIIHPFMDGNGRTTRLITTAILGLGGLDRFEIFSFENYYNQNIAGYFRAVGLQGNYYDLEDTIDFTQWLEYFTDGVLDELVRIRSSLPGALGPAPRIEPHHRQILDYTKEHGSITQREYASISPRSLAARKLDFEKLLELDLIETQGMGRGTYYILKNR